MSVKVSRERLAQALFNPRSVALIGASGDIKKNTARPQRFLKQHGYTGRVFPVNPSRDEILGERAYPNVGAIPQAVDHAFIMVPTERVMEAVRECGAAGIPIATIYSDGFADVGDEGRVRQDALVVCAREAGVRIIGPNCMGITSVHEGLALSVNAVLEIDAIAPGSISVVSQSGSMMGAVLSRGLARGLGFAKLVSVGNEADLAVGEIVDLMVDDEKTGVIALFMETLRDADALARAARRAYAAGKPVVVYKLGRSSVGAALALSHTGALAGSDEAVGAFFRAHGIVRVESFETLIEIAPLLVGRRPVITQEKPRVAVVTTTGGGAASVADRMGLLGLDVATPDDALVATLAARGVTIRKTPIIDLTLAATSGAYSEVLAALAAWSGCDAVLGVVGSSAQFHPQLAVKPIVAATRGAKPLSAFLTPEANESLKVLAAASVPAFRTPESCAEAHAAFFAWRAPVALPERTINLDALRGKQRFTELDALAVFRDLGVSTAASALATAPEFTHNVPYPVAVKIASADITHKSDLGGVALDIRDAVGLRETAMRMIVAAQRAHPSATIDGVTVQAMQRGLGEAIIGYRHDEQVGPIVLVGAGGTLAEIYRDTQIECAPVDLATARSMVAAVKGFAVLRGYRGAPVADLDALAQAVVAFSQLACVAGQPVAEAEINPMVVGVKDAIAVDGVLVLREGS